MNSEFLFGLANHLWQSTLFAAVAGALTLLVRKNSARVRYLLWLAASAKFLLPFSLLIAMGAQFPFGPAEEAQPSFLVSAGQMAVPFTQTNGGGVRAATQNVSDFAAVMPIALGALWALGTVAVTCRWFARWKLVRRALRESTPTPLEFAIPVRSSSSQLEPGVVGILRQVLLLPRGMEERLTPAQMSAVLTHERSHVAWRDNLAAALHMLVEALFWFHPLVWWLGSRIIEERERACDEQVLADGHAPDTYAEGILRICEHYLESRLPCVAGVSGANLRQRIEGIMKNRMIERLSGIRKVAITTIAAATIAAPLAAGVLTSPTVRAQTASPDAAKSTFRNVTIQLTSATDGAVNFNVARRSDDMVELRGVGLRGMIANAYGVTESQVTGMDWSKAPRYDITAEGVGLSPMDDTVPTAMRNLLRERFGLVVKIERKQMDGYVLLIAAGGSKLVANGGDRSSRGVFRVGPTGVEAIKFPLSTLVKPLEAFLKAPVVDETGLQGNFDYRATWDTASPGTPPDLRTVTKALAEQLGLQLEARPLNVQVIEVVSVNSPDQVVTKVASK